MKAQWIRDFKHHKPAFNSLKELRKDYIYDDGYKKEANVEYGIGIANDNINARFVLFPPLGSHIKRARRDLEQLVGEPGEELHIQGKSRHTVVFRKYFDLQNPPTWPPTFNWAEQRLNQLRRFFLQHRASFRAGRYP